MRGDNTPIQRSTCCCRLHEAAKLDQDGRQVNQIVIHPAGLVGQLSPALVSQSLSDSTLSYSAFHRRQRYTNAVVTMPSGSGEQRHLSTLR